MNTVTASPGQTGSRRAARKQGSAVLLDLAGDERAARRWAEDQLAGQHIQTLNKADLKWGSKREALARLRALSPQTFAMFTADLGAQSGRAAMIVFGAVAGARRVVMGDRAGRVLTRSRAGALLIEAPRLALELLAGYGLLVPLSWLLTLALGGLLRIREVARSNAGGRRPPLNAERATAPLTALHIRATLTNFAEGGMPTHVEGFARGAHALGHRLIFLASGGGQGAGSAAGRVAPARLIKPSATFGATKALFELWNNFTFTAEAVFRVMTAPRARGEFDFIYQRYSRFNWTGVALSIVTGLPLALEYNGSEVWISRAWDRVGQLWLLKRFERLNLRAADVIFTVSEVERRNLIRAGVAPGRVIANPNGVDPEEFRPDCGGKEIRREMGIADKIVVGFLGTFGPWHGAPILAEAAARVSQLWRYHFFFVGDGDQRPATEAILTDAKVAATFAGRVPHHRAAAYLDACDILASPHVPSADGSEFFGSPTKLFEYMAMARPIVASRLGQIGDVIVDGDNGLLVEPGDADALARAIERLADDQELRHRLGAAARRTVMERYTWRHNAARVFEAMRNLKI